MTEAASLSPAYRLVTPSEDGASWSVCTPGSYDLGSDPDNDLVLSERGVSRHHARLHLADDGSLTVEDLDSKNGTFVGDHRVTEPSLVPPGTRLCLGIAELQVEPLHPDDARLAISASLDDASSQPSEPTPSSLQSTAAFLDAGGKTEDPVELLRMLEDVADLMRSGRPGDLSRILHLLLKEVDRTGICLVEWRPGGEPMMLAAWGPPPPDHLVSTFHRTLDELSTPGRSAFAFRTAPYPGGEVSTLCLYRPEPPHMAVAVFGERGLDETEDLPLLRLFLRWLGVCRHGVSPYALDTEGRHPDLDFPPHFEPGRSEAMVQLFDTLRGIAGSDLPVLITGETGVGKELVAQLLHRSSPRRQGPFVAVNCAAIPDELLEAEMFGVGKGVATGVDAREGTLARADGGTLLLDEVGELPHKLQAKLLRALQEGTIEPLGRPPREVDVRILAATNVPLEEHMEAGTFRTDLYYRLAGDRLRIPPLRERSSDIPLLIERFLRRELKKSGKKVAGLTIRTLEVLCRYPWPGNVRELENEVSRLVHRCPPGQPIDSRLVSAHIRTPDPETLPEEPEDLGLDLPKHVERLERILIRRALEETGGNRSRAAELLHISRNGLADKIKRLEIDDV